VEVAVAGGGTDVLEGDVERTDIFEKGLLDAHAEEEAVLDADHGVTEADLPAERAETLPVPRDEKFPVRLPRADVAPGHGVPDQLVASECPVDVAPGQEEAGPAREEAFAPDQEEAGPAQGDAGPAQPGKPRTSQAWTSKLSMLLVAVVALAGLAVLAVAIAREVTSANASDDVGDLGYVYTCDRVSGSDPGVYGVGNCHASCGMQASGVIPVGQSYVLTPRKANALGYTQTFSCSGGRADSPSMVVPKRCAALGNPVMASR
jgi:hypothetical protein